MSTSDDRTRPPKAGDGHPVADRARAGDSARTRGGAERPRPIEERFRVIADRWRAVEALAPRPSGALYRVEAIAGGAAGQLELSPPLAERGQLARFDREARILSRLRHPRCVALLDFGVHEGHPFVVTELFGGKPLAELLGTPELSPRRALRIANAVVEGLEYLHAHGLVHRDLDPSVVFLDESFTGETIKIGLPRVAGVDGTPGGRAAADRSRAPEEAGGGRGDHRADLFAVGRLLEAMCAGAAADPPAEGAAPAEDGRPRPTGDRELREAIARIVARATARKAEARFQSAAELRAALQRFGVALAPPTAAPAAAPRRRGVSPIAAVAAVAGLCALTLLLVAGFARGRRSAPAPIAAERAAEPRAPVHPADPSADPSAELPPAPPPPAPAPIAAAPRAGAPNAAGPPTAAGPSAAPGREAGRPRGPTPPRAAAPAEAPVPPDERTQIWALIDGGELGPARAQVLRAMTSDPGAGWPHVAMAELYCRRLWRRDCLKHWTIALEKDPELRFDPRLTARLCQALGPPWQKQGLDRFLDLLGPEVALRLERCAAEARGADKRAAAQRALARVRRAHGREAPAPR